MHAKRRQLEKTLITSEGNSSAVSSFREAFSRFLEVLQLDTSWLELFLFKIYSDCIYLFIFFTLFKQTVLDAIPPQRYSQDQGVRTTLHRFAIVLIFRDKRVEFCGVKMG